MEGSEARAYRFAEVELYPRQGRLVCGGRETHLRQKSFQVLTYLVEHHDRLITKAELLDHLWRDTAVTEGALTKCIIDIRQALGDDSQQPKFVKNIPRAGYRFIHPVEEVAPNDSASTLSIVTEETTSVEIEYTEVGPVAEPQAAAALPAGAKFFSAGRRKLAAVLAALALVACAALAGRWLTARGGAETEPALPRVPGKKALVVMYFDNQSGSRELDWMREGLADMVITNLSRADNLTVLSRQQFHLLLERKGHQPGSNIRFDEALEIARRSRAEVFILGSFATVGEQVRVSVQLYDTADGRLLTGEQLVVDEPSQILTRVNLLTARLAAHLGPAAPRQEAQSALVPVGTSDLEAYRYYSLGLEKALGFENAEAISLLKKAVRLDPEFAMAHARIGYTYAITWTMPDQAKPYLEKAFRMSDRLTEKERLDITAWYAVANQDFEGAVRTYREIIRLYPLETESYNILGRLLISEGRFGEALEVGKQGLAADPEAKDLYNVVGGAHMFLGQPEEAVAAQREYVRLAPREPNAYDSLGLTYQWFGRYAEAIETYNRGLDVDPEFDIAVFHLANAHFQTGRYREAQRVYRRYAELARSEGERGLAYRAIGLIHWRRGELAEAEAMAARESRSGERPGTIHFLLAAERGEWPKAAKIVDGLKSLTGRGGRGPGRFYHWSAGHLALKSGLGDEALEHFRAALKEVAPLWDADPSEDSLANAYLHLGRLDEAVAEYERVLRLNPNYPLAHYHLAQAYERKGERARARDYYERFLRTWKDADPDIPEVTAAKKALAWPYAAP